MQIKENTVRNDTIPSALNFVKNVRDFKLINGNSKNTRYTDTEQVLQPADLHRHQNAAVQGIMRNRFVNI